MEINPFILALSKTLPESCLQGLVIYLLLQLLFFIDKRSTPLSKFNAFYLANWCLFAGFIYTFFRQYQQIQVIAFDPSLLSNLTRTHHSTLIIKPNLWLQFSFRTNHYAYLITGFYLVGLLFYILKLTIGLINISWFRSNKNLKLDNYLTQLSIQLSSSFRLIKTVSVFVSDKISVPLTFGFIKPIIVFPIALINQLSVEQTEAILLHELAHIKRNDYLLNVLLCIVQSFLFFNPAIWLMKREINQFREQCCDDLVLDNTSHKIAYAHALLLIEQNRNDYLNLTLASNGKKYTLLNRIKRITNMKSNENLPQNKFVVLLLAFIVIGLTVAWNLPVKKAIQHLTVQSFKVVKEIQDTGKVEQFTDVYHNKSASPKKTKLLNNKKAIQSFDDIMADTTIKSKNKFKIVLEDSLGNKKDYNSINELPIDARNEFLSIDTSNYTSVRKYYNSPEWKMKEDAINKMGRDVDNYYNSPEWKKKEDAINKMGRDVDNYYNSSEWKKKMLDIKIYGEKLRKQINGPEWKKQQEEVREQDERLRKQMSNPEFRKQVEEIQKQFNSPEWKKQMEDIRVQGEQIQKQFNSSEWKNQQKKIRKEIEKLQKEWQKNYDEQRKPAMPEKPIIPQNLY